MNVAVWSGDIVSSFEELLKQIKVAQNVASIWNLLVDNRYWRLSSCWNLDDYKFQELLLRWFQFGAFCPLFRSTWSTVIHLCQIMNAAFLVVIMKYGYLNIVAQIIEIIKLRESLRDYIEYHLNISHQNGTPILRPMFYDFNNDMESLSI